MRKFPLPCRASALLQSLLALAVLLGTGTGRAAAQERPVLMGPPPEVESYGVRAGDEIITNFFTAAGDRLDAIAGTRIVDREGNLFFPYVGTVNVAGLDARGIRVRLEELYASYYADPVVDITVQLRVNVTGAVRNPGSYLVSPSTTIVGALGEAGGAGLEVVVANTQVPADPTQVRLIRDGATYILNLRATDVELEALQTKVQSGDWIFVPPRARSRVRDEVLFWGTVLSFVGSIASLIILIGR